MAKHSNPFNPGHLILRPVVAPLDGAAPVVQAARALAVIETAEHANAAGAMLRGVRTRLRSIETHYKTIRKAVKDSIKEAVTKIDTMENEDAADWREADAILSAPLLAWQVEQEQKAEADRRAALATAEAKAKEEQARQAEALRAAAAAAPTKTAAKHFERQARQVEKAEPLPVLTGLAPEAATVDGVSVPKRWVCDVNDPLTLLAAVARGDVSMAAVTINGAWLNAQAVSHGKDLRIPGCTPRQVPGLSVKGL